MNTNDNTFQEVNDLLASKLQEKGLDKAYLRYLISYEVSKDPSAAWTLKKNKRIQIRSVPEEFKDKGEEFNNELRKLVSEKPEWNKFLEGARLKTTPEAGNKFITIKDVKKVFGEEKNVDIEHKPGQILFVGFWANWSESARKQMNNYNNILNRHAAAWGDKVRFVGISLDATKDTVVERVNERNWNKVEHFFIQGWESEWEFYERETSDHNALKNYVGDMIPLGVLVDPEGTIVWIGHPSTTNVEDKINSLLNPQDSATYNKTMKDLKKYAKEQLYPRLKDISPEKNNFQFNLTISRKKNFGEKSVYQQPELTCEYSIKQKGEIQPLLDEIFSKFDKSHFFFKEIVTDHKSNLKNALTFFSDQLPKNNLSEVVLKHQDVSYFDSQDKQEWGVKYRSLLAEKGVNPEKIDSTVNIAKALKEFFDAHPREQTQILRNFRLNANVDVGDNFVPFEAGELFTENKSQVEHKKGEVILLDFWATWCGPCQKPMAHNQEMLEKNEEKWKGSVRFIGASIDDDKSVVVERVNSRNWKKIEHYIILSDDKKTCEIYGINSIPCIFLIDKEGKIVFRGHPSSINIEEKINELLEEKSEAGAGTGAEAEKKTEQKNLITREEYKKLRRLLNSPDLKNFVCNELSNAKFSVVLKKIRKYDSKGNLISEEYSRPNVQIQARTVDYEKVKPTSSQIFAIVPEDRCEVEKKLLETISIKFGEKCNACEKQLKPFDPQYYCKFCNLWFCEECGDKVDETKTGVESLVHPHHLAWIRVKKDTEMHAIDEYKFGKNLKDNGTQNFPASCNGCGNGVRGGPRWICISCRPGPLLPNGFVDLCHACRNVLKNENTDSPKCKEIIDNLARDKHDPDSHIFLRVYFSNGDYYNY